MCHLLVIGSLCLTEAQNKSLSTPVVCWMAETKHSNKETDTTGKEAVTHKNTSGEPKPNPQMHLPSPTMSTSTHTSHKKPTRHHVKRKSGGRVHVTKLAPMARAHSNTAVPTETETEGDYDTERKPMRRSQSQRSLHRLSSFDKKGGMTGMTCTQKNTATHTRVTDEHTPSPPTTPPSKPIKDSPEDSPADILEETQVTPIDRAMAGESIAPPSRTTTTHPGFAVSRNIPAAPVEQTFNAIANTLVTPNNAAAPAMHEAHSPTHPAVLTDTTARKKPLLRSQFVEVDTHDSPPPHSRHHPRPHMSNVASAAIAQPAGMTRTQQKLMLQRQHTLVDDENNLAHPRNMIRLTRELERMGREYQCVKKYQDPMMESLIRCAGRPLDFLDPTAARARATAGAETKDKDAREGRTRVGPTRMLSSALLPTTSQSESSLVGRPHYEHRQAAHRRQLYKAIQPSQFTVQSQHQTQSNTKQGVRWSAGAFIDRMLHG
ncbi:hypothetical protein BDF14DRAFT_1740569 [Spinellus fusiger]|nr:hypothetical protein BDF14DRAFT_1740569 [Spinellus fusiger]